MTIQTEQLRRITGTVVAAILGQHDFGMSAFEAQQKILGNLPDIPETVPMRHGLRLELPGGFLDQEAHDYYGTMPMLAEGVIVHPTHEFLAAHLDRTLPGDVPEILEYKCSGNPTMWGPDLSQEIPNTYYWQIVHQMLCLPQAPRVHLQAFLGVGDVRHYCLERDDLRTSLSFLEPHLVSWYDRHIVKEVPIDPNTPAEAVISWSQSQAKKLKPMTQTTKDGLRTLFHVKQSISQLEEKADAVKLDLMKDLQDLEGYVGADGKAVLRWKTHKGSRRLDQKALKAAHPKIFEEFYTPGAPFRPFTPEWKGIERMFGGKK